MFPATSVTFRDFRVAWLVCDKRSNFGHEVEMSAYSLSLILTGQNPSSALISTATKFLKFCH